MIRIRKIAFVGGDKRQLYMKRYFDSLGFETHAFAANGINFIDENFIENTDAVIFPLPFEDKNGYIFSNTDAKYKIKEIINIISENSSVFAGMISPRIECLFNENRLKVYDYFKREEIAIKNAVPTVQGILKTIFDNIDYTLFSSKCAVFGYGKIGKIVAETLHTLGAEVTVFARKESDIALAETKQLKSCRISEKSSVINSFDIIINTVPAMMIDENILKKLKKNVLIIDVASAPYGVDYEQAKKLGINALLCPSLPGRTAPVNAGIILAEGVLNIMKEENYV